MLCRLLFSKPLEATVACAMTLSLSDGSIIEVGIIGVSCSVGALHGKSFCPGQEELEEHCMF